MKIKKWLSVLLTAAMALSLTGVNAIAAEEYSFDSVTVNDDGTIDGVEGEHVTLTVDGVETALEPGTYTGDIAVTVTEEYTVLSSGGGAPGGGAPGGGSGEASTGSGESSQSYELPKTILGTEIRSNSGATDYRTALYIDETGLQSDYSATAVITGGSYDSESAEGISVTAGSDTFSGLVVKGAEYTIADSSIVLDTDSEGGSTNDFTGLGAAISAAGAGTMLYIENCIVETSGVVKPALFIAEGADVVILASSLSANAGEVYDTYLSNANQNSMIGAPWHLGIDNAVGNSRAVNLMGAQSTETIVDSSIYAAGWGGLSVDDGSYMRMDVINSSIAVEEGYGAFAIGQVTETYYGSAFETGVLGFIMMGGHVTMRSYTGGDIVTVKRMEVKDSGEGIDTYYAQETDEVVCEVSSETVAEGETMYSSVVSDRFGVEMHSMMLNDTVNAFSLLDGSSMTCGETSFIVKSGFAEITVDNASVTTGESPYTGETVFLQLMDNDDAFCGLTDFQYSNFGEYFWEPDGWSFEFEDTTDVDDYDQQGNAGYDVMSYGTEGRSALEQWWTKVDLTDTDIVGDIWNSTGYFTQGGSDLYVTIGEGASVTGLISSGAYQHYAKTYEVGLYGYYAATGDYSIPLEENVWYNSDNSGSWENAKYISVVVNTPYFYGANGTEVTVEDGGVWNVTDTCFVTGLTVDGGEINGASAIYAVAVEVGEKLDNLTNTVTVVSCDPVEWDGGDIELAAEDNTTLFVIVPEGGDIDDIIVVGESLGCGAADFEGLYLGSFYTVEDGLLETPLDIYGSVGEEAADEEIGDDLIHVTVEDGESYLLLSDLLSLLGE